MLFQFTHITDEEGNILNRYEYDAFGNFTLKEETIENRFAFTGEQYDPVSQLYYLRARFYSPAIGRFIQEDTYYGDGLNLYAYCHNNPVGYVDPSGHAKTKKQTPINDMKYDDIKKELEDYYADFVKEKRKNIPTTSKDLLPNELFYDHFGDLPNEVGDNLTGHHMPADSYMAQYQKDRNKSYAMFFEQPGKGGRHRRTFTYGRTDGGRAKQLYNALTPRDALAFDLRDMRRILNEDIAGVTDFKLRKALRERINQQMKDYINAYKNDENFKELFDKNSIYNQIAPCGRRKYRG